MFWKKNKTEEEPEKIHLKLNELRLKIRRRYYEEITPLYRGRNFFAALPEVMVDLIEMYNEETNNAKQEQETTQSNGSSSAQSKVCCKSKNSDESRKRVCQCRQAKEAVCKTKKDEQEAARTLKSTSHWGLK